MAEAKFLRSVRQAALDQATSSVSARLLPLGWTVVRGRHRSFVGPSGRVALWVALSGGRFSWNVVVGAKHVIRPLGGRDGAVRFALRVESLVSRWRRGLSEEPRGSSPVSPPSGDDSLGTAEGKERDETEEYATFFEKLAADLRAGRIESFAVVVISKDGTTSGAGASDTGEVGRKKLVPGLESLLAGARGRPS